jgi:protocatechuate 3,4-dioxygenase beta subunit
MSKSANTESGSQTEVNFDLPRGVWIEGRVTDKQSGQGLAGWLGYYIHDDNPYYAPIRPLGWVDLRDRYQSDQNGRFRIPALPGGGVISFLAFDHQKYPRGAGAASIRGAKRADGSEILRTSPVNLVSSNYHIVAEVNPPEGAQRVEVNLELDAGESAVGKIVGPDGEPIRGAQYASRLAQVSTWDFANGDSFELVGYDPGQPRRVLIYHAEQNLAGSCILRGAAPKDLVVKLQPAGKARGRLVDAEGEPLAGMMLVPWSPRIASPADVQPKAGELDPVVPLPPNRPGWRSGEHETDAQGRFEFVGLVPGVEYRVRAFDRASMTP